MIAEWHEEGVVLSFEDETFLFFFFFSLRAA